MRAESANRSVSALARATTGAVGTTVQAQAP